jgi:heat shock protein HslJ
MTRMACAENALNRQETAFGQALAEVDRYEVRGDVLLLYAGSTLRARLSRIAAVEPPGL